MEYEYIFSILREYQESTIKFDKNVFLFQFFLNVFLFCDQKNKSIRILGEVKLSQTYPSSSSYVWVNIYTCIIPASLTTVRQASLDPSLHVSHSLTINFPIFGFFTSIEFIFT